MLRIFPPLKIRRLRPGLNPRTWIPEASTLTPRPPKPLIYNVTSRRMYIYRWTEHCRAGGTIGRCAAVMSSARRRAEHSCHSWQRNSSQYFSAFLLQIQRKGRERLTKEVLFMSAFEPETYQIQGRNHINLSAKCLLFDSVTNLMSRYKYWILTDGRLRERTLCADHPNLCPESPKLV
jgi:hypothetical protein